MHIFITGGTGFIGRHLCHLLHEHHHTLTVLSRQADTKVKQLCGETAILHHLDELTPAHRFDAVVNLAGEPIIGPPWTKKRRQTLWDSRVTLTRRLVEWIGQARQKPTVLVSGSAVGFYGNQGDRVIDESTPPVKDGFGQRLCEAWEQAAGEAIEYGVRVCTLRTGPVLGKGGGLLARMLPVFKLGLGGRLGSGKQWFPWIALEDHIQMTKRLIEDQSLDGAFNLTAPTPVTNAQFTATLASMVGRPAFCHIPAPVLRLTMGEMAEILLASQRVIPARFQALVFPFSHESLEKSLEHILAS